MAIRTYKVTLDSKNSIAPEPVFLRQGDKTGAVVIDATLMDNGSPVSLSGLTPMFKANTANGQAVIVDSTGFNIVNASGGEFTYQVPSQLGSVSGKIKIAYFSFSDSSGVQSTFNVVFFVEKAADMTQENAKDWVSNLNEIIDQYNQWVNNAHSSWQDFVNANKQIIESIDPGGVLLSEITSARQDAEGNVYASIGERLDDLYHGYSDKLGLKGDVIADAAAKVANVKTDKSILKIGLINDLHFQKMVDPSWYNTATLDADHVKLYGLFANKINAIVLNGDNVHGQEIGEDSTGLVPFSGSREVLIKRNKEIMDIANYAVPNADVFANIGNHDDGSVRWSNPLTLDELKQGYGVESFDAFKDYADQKVRVIILNVFDNSETELKRATNSVIKQSQLDWLANTALQVPAGYATVIFTHAPLEGFFYNKPYSADWKNVNHDLVKGMLAAFIHGTAYKGVGDNGTVNVDFTSQGARDLIGIISGHEHVDTEPEVSNGIRGFMRTCSVGVGTGRVLGEYSELANDLIEIDVSNRTIKFNRIGYGDDLEVAY